MALGEVTLPQAVSRIFSEQELEEALRMVADAKSVGDGPYESNEVTKKNRKGKNIQVDEGEVTARGLANNLRQHMMLRSNGRYVETRGENRQSGTALRTKVWEDTDGWYFAVFEAQVEAGQPVDEDE